MIKNEIIVKDEIINEMTVFDEQLIRAFQFLGLPQNILVPVNERKKVFKNIEDVVNILTFEQREQATYISKFVAAVGAGLFDAALNYLWDETISQLRTRVCQYDLDYFYDLAISSPERRNKLRTAEDLLLIDDSELIKGSKEIGLLSDVGYKLLDHIKYMRNWASAAHPNQVNLTGLQLMGWLETCINEVICLPLTSVTVHINQLLKNIKCNLITADDAKVITIFFCELTEEKADALMNGFVGIFCRKDTTMQTRQNILLLVKDLWNITSENTRNSIGIKYAQFLASGEKESYGLIRELIDSCGGQSYLPDGIKASEIKDILANLRLAHSSMNNFYNEPMFARELKRVVGDRGIPKECDFEYAHTLTYVFLTNASGVAWNAEPSYIELIKNLNQKQAMIAMLSFRNDEVSSKLQFSLCKQKYGELIDLIDSIIVTPLFRELFEEVRKYKDLKSIGDNEKLNEKILLVRKALTV